MRIAIIHDWLTGMRGGEYVLEAMCELLPDAELFTLIHIKGKLSPLIESKKIHTSFLQRVPNIDQYYRHFLPLMPKAIESFDLSGFDLVVSSSHCVAKGVKKAEGAVHVSYIHAPMRYIWNRFDDYFGPGKASVPVRFAAKILRSSLQTWDQKVSTPERVDYLVANSSYIAKQILQAYQREAAVIYPFADLGRFRAPRNPGGNYLMVGAFAPYKRIDLAIEAFNRLKLPLEIIGSGQDEDKLRSLAGPTVKFLGTKTNEDIAQYLSQCRGFVFPGVEDFGITLIEAMAAGAPVIAYNEGGAAESIDVRSGILFSPQSVEALIAAVESFESGISSLNEQACRDRAAQFSKAHFQEKFKALIVRAWANSRKNPLDLKFGV